MFLRKRANTVCTKALSSTSALSSYRGGTPSNGPIRGGSSRKGHIFQGQVDERVGMSVVEVHNGVGNSVISVCKFHFVIVEKSIKHNGFVIYSYFKGSAFTAAVKNDVKV